MSSADRVTFLVRHGEVLNPDHVVYADLDGYGLSELGRAQAAEAAGRLPPGPTIVSSPLQRAVETASIIAERLESTITIDDDLTEWRLARRWAGVVWESLDEAFPGELSAYLEHPEELPFSEESLGALANRVAGAIRRHHQAALGALVVVSHQDPIQAGRLRLTGKPLSGQQRDKPGHAAIIELVAVRDEPWTELSLWAPAAVGEVFPPIEGRRSSAISESPGTED